MRRRRRPVCVLAFLALGAGVCVSQLFVLFPWRALFAVGAAMVVLAAAALYDRNGLEQQFRAYGRGFFDGRHQAFREVADRLDAGDGRNAPLREFLEAQAPPQEARWG